MLFIILFGLVNCLPKPVNEYRYNLCVEQNTIEIQPSEKREILGEVVTNILFDIISCVTLMIGSILWMIICCIFNIQLHILIFGVMLWKIIYVLICYWYNILIPYELVIMTMIYGYGICLMLYLIFTHIRWLIKFFLS